MVMSTIFELLRRNSVAILPYPSWTVRICALTLSKSLESLADYLAFFSLSEHKSATAVTSSYAKETLI